MVPPVPAAKVRGIVRIIRGACRLVRARILGNTERLISFTGSPCRRFFSFNRGLLCEHHGAASLPQVRSRRPVVLLGDHLLDFSLFVVVTGVIARVLAMVVAIAFVMTRRFGRVRRRGIGTAATRQGNQGGSDKKDTGKLK